MKRRLQESFRRQGSGVRSRKLAKRSRRFLKEASNDLSVIVVFVSGNNDYTKEFDSRNWDGDWQSEVEEELGSDDYEVDQIWTENKNTAFSKALQETVEQNSLSDVLEMLFTEDDDTIEKAMYLISQGQADDLKEAIKEAEEVYIFETGIHERMIETGRNDYRYPESFVYYFVEGHMDLNMPKWMENNIAYFEEGFAKMIRDMEFNGELDVTVYEDRVFFKYN